ncbi:Transcription elongation factor 1-like protein [Cardamine amara subsp. amara]|uniref:Transcription elongation factor 1 homolog n=1 Tax=Cardamine amara subsp. amara TaxID=228776 RepID=A0ABD1AIN7_CARAN
MGKRKSRAKPAPTKRMDKLDTVFSCPFCNHGSSVECIIDMKNLIGSAACRICEESFSTTITALTEAIDIYSEWIDECERVNTVEDDVEQEEEEEEVEEEEEEEDDEDDHVSVKRKYNNYRD